MRDRILLVSTTVGTGPIVFTTPLNSRWTGFTAADNGARVTYLIENQSDLNQVELVEGFLNFGANQLSRVKQLFPVPGGAPLNLTPGTKHITVAASFDDVFPPEIVVSNPASPYSWDTSDHHRVLITGLNHDLRIDASLLPSNGTRLVLTVSQDSIGGRKVFWGTNFDYASMQDAHLQDRGVTAVPLVVANGKIQLEDGTINRLTPVSGSVVGSLLRGIAVNVVSALTSPIEVATWIGSGGNTWSPPTTARRPELAAARTVLFRSATQDLLAPGSLTSFIPTPEFVLSGAIRCNGAGVTGSELCVDVGQANVAGIRCFLAQSGNTLQLVLNDPTGNLTFTIPGILDNTWHSFAFYVHRTSQICYLLSDVVGLEFQQPTVSKVVASWAAEPIRSIGFVSAGTAVIEVAGLELRNATGYSVANVQAAFDAIRGTVPLP